MIDNDRKRQIIREAMRLFGRYGYDKVTVKQLARTCGITEPALYRYFPSKEAIYDTVLDSLESVHQYRELFARLEREEDVGVILFDLAAHILEFFRRHRELYRLLLYSALREHSKARQVFRTIRAPYVTFLMQQLKRLQAAGRVKRKNHEITARCFIGMVFDCALGATLWRGFQGKVYSPEKIIANNVPLFVNGLVTTRAASGRRREGAA